LSKSWLGTIHLARWRFVWVRVAGHCQNSICTWKNKRQEIFKNVLRFWQIGAQDFWARGHLWSFLLACTESISKAGYNSVILPQHHSTAIDKRNYLLYEPCVFILASTDLLVIFYLSPLTCSKDVNKKIRLWSSRALQQVFAMLSVLKNNFYSVIKNKTCTKKTL